MKRDLIEAATRVLERHGPAAFTTNRVAEAAGVSIGSVYQYFPNKAALLIALHEREAERAWQELAELLKGTQTPPRARFEQLISAFFQIQGEAQAQHDALSDAQASPSSTLAFLAFEQQVVAALAEFFRAATGKAADECEFLAAFTFTVVTSIGERLASRSTPPDAMRRVGTLTAHMLATELGL